MAQPANLFGPLDSVILELRRLQSYDKYVESELATCNTFMGRWGAGFGVSVALMIVLFIIEQPTLAILLACFITLPCLVMLIIWGVKRAKWAKEDMENRRVELALRFFSVIGQDISRKAKCAVHISFDPYQKHGQLVNQSGGTFSSFRQKKYVDTWFNAKGSLCDATNFKVKIEQTINCKEKQKRKYTKVRERIDEEITLVLRIAPESYPNWPQLQQTLLPCALNGVQVRRVQVRDGIVRIIGVTGMQEKHTGRYGSNVTGETNLASGDALLGMFIYVYSQLQTCRAPGATPAA